MLFTIKELNQLFTKHNQPQDETLVIEQVTIDSRKQAEKSLFIPIIGDTFNGHEFVEQAIENGAIAIIWDEKEKLPPSIPSDFPVFYTSNTTIALQKLAAHYREVTNPIVIAITGSNGKTTTKDLLSSILQTTYRTHATEGNLNNHIGLPLTILSMPRNIEVLVLELGMNDFGEIDILSRIAKPDYAMITNVGESHIEYLGSREGIAKAKLEIVNGLKEEGILVIDGDEILLKEIDKEEDFQVLACGFTAGNDLQIQKTEIVLDGTFFTLANGAVFHVPLLGEHHAKNAALALQVAKLLKIPQELQKEGLQKLAHTSSRFETLQGKSGATLVDDSYNASPTSMKGAIEVIKRMKGFSTKILVLGDILELGSFADDMHRSIGKVITSPITHLYTYGEKANLIHEEIPRDAGIITKHFQSKETLTKTLINDLSKDSIVLFKASRGLQFETIIKPLEIENIIKDSN